MSIAGYETTRNIKGRSLAPLRELRWCLPLARRGVGLRRVWGRVVRGPRSYAVCSAGRTCVYCEYVTSAANWNGLSQSDREAIVALRLCDG